jgi:hypothetical protein
MSNIEANIGTTPLLKLFTGTVPANCAAADPAGLVVNMTLPSDWLEAAANGAVNKTATAWTANASANGTVNSWRIKDSTNTTCHIQGNCTNTGNGGDMTLDNIVIAINQTVTITGFLLTAPNA